MVIAASPTMPGLSQFNQAPAGLLRFPCDLEEWCPRADLLTEALSAARRTVDDSFLEFIESSSPEFSSPSFPAPRDERNRRTTCPSASSNARFRPTLAATTTSTAPESSVAHEGALALLTYAYLQGIYDPSDIVRLLDIDPMLESLRTEFSPDPGQIRTFRRNHRAALTQCLARALAQLTPARYHRGPLEPFMHHARERVDDAVVFDSMSRDE